MIRIAEVVPGSIAEELALRIGSRVVRINGHPVRDGIDFRFLESDETLEVEIEEPGGPGVACYEIEKDAADGLGIVPAPDKVRECANKCVFCFIDGNPPGVRESLYLRDDDFRLSFAYGSYVTLTNLGPKGFARLLEQRLSPLYVSVHATEPEVRMRLLGVPRGEDIVEQLRTLTTGGIEVHTQVVLCPGWNDGEHLDRTLEDLWAIGPGVLSVSVVPVGLTRYNLHRPVRLLTSEAAATALAQVERVRRRAQRSRGTGWAYAADELYLMARVPIPPAGYYDDWPLTENGVGAVRRFLDAFNDGVGGVPMLAGKRIALVTGTRMAEILEPLVPRLGRATGASVQLLGVENRLFGETVTTAGLLPGGDVLAALAAWGPCDVVVLPAAALNDDGVFIDDVRLSEVVRAVAPGRVVSGDEPTAALNRL